MSRNLVLLVLALLVGVGLAVWLLGGGLSPDGDGDEVSRDAPAEADADGLEAGGRAAIDRPGADDDDGAVLFGRPRHERVGLGHVTGRVLAVETGAPVGGAKMLLTGTGHGDEVVTVRIETNEEGAFRFSEVPAGDEYAIRLEAAPLPVRSLPGVTVRGGAATDLGTLWLGARVAFEGRVVGPEGRGVANADVRVHAGHFSLLELFSNFTDFFSNLDREPEPLARTRTDGRGHFAFAALDPGTITLTVRAAGYAPASEQTVASEGVDASDRLVIRLGPGGVVAGKVVDAQGAGLAGVHIAAVTGDDPESFLYGRIFAESGSDGRFRIDSAAPGADEITLLASMPGYPVAMAKAPPGTDDMVIVLDRSATVVVKLVTDATGEPVEGAKVLLGIEGAKSGRGGDPECILAGVTDATGRVTFDAHPGKIQMAWITGPEGRAGMWAPEQGPGMGGPASLKGPSDPVVKAGRREIEFRMQDTIELAGTVKDADGRPIANARILTSTGIQMGRPVFSDADGRYRVSVARGGFVLLAVNAVGYVPVQELVSRLPEENDPVHDLTLARASVVSGRVVTADGRPVAGARVRSRGGKETGVPGLSFLDEAETLTGKQGRYVLDGVAPGEEVRILARHASFADAASEAFPVGQDGSARAPDLVMPRGVAVEVLVRDPSGRPLPGSGVELSYDRGEVPKWDRMQLWGRDEGLRTDSAGRARVENVPPATVTVSASHPDHAPGTVERKVGADAVSPVRIEVSLTRAVVLAGQVLDAGGSPIAEVWVTAEYEGASTSFEEALTDADGRFRIGNLPDGPVTLRANKDGYRAYEAEVPASPARITVRMTVYDPEDAARLAEIGERLLELYDQMGKAEDAAERRAVRQQIRALQGEKSAIELSGDDDER